jgi:phage terminase Nu1 subunit (DNA packaging protein)
MLKITASLADGIPVDLREALTGLDQHNLDLLVTAIRHACGQRPAAGAP